MGTAEFFYNYGYYLSYPSFKNNQVNNSNIVVTKVYNRKPSKLDSTRHLNKLHLKNRKQHNCHYTEQLQNTLYEIGSYGAMAAYDPDTGITINQNRFIYGGYYGSSLEAVSLVTGQALWNGPPT